MLALIFVLEGVATIFLSSYFGVAWGILSIVVGGLILFLLPPTISAGEMKGESVDVARMPETFGIRIVNWAMKEIGNDYLIMGIGAAIIILDVVFNAFVSERSGYGDLDTLSIMFGGAFLLYPLVVDRFRVEITFVLLFLASVMIILVIPQSVTALSGGSGSAASSWYVHYMLATPMAGGLNLLGVDASASQEYVTMTFRDGRDYSVGISTACAGLYSFSIFVSAFFAYSLVFERFQTRLMVLVLGIGLLAAYLGNVLRMIIIGLVGVYYGMDSLRWAHKNVGWIIFLSWSILFWYIVMRYAEKRNRDASSPQQK